jgi:RHS repeat-associated protein
MTQYLYGNLSNPFQVTASRAPDNTLTVYYYDDFGALYALERGGARYYVGSDHLGTPKVVTDNTGTIVRQVEYDSWGVKISDTNPGFDIPVGFAGGIPDDATGLVRFGFRDYEPATGRWTAKDPIFFRGGQFNLFGYAGNDPVNLKDPSGLCIENRLLLGTITYMLSTASIVALETGNVEIAAGLKLLSAIGSVAIIGNAWVEYNSGEMSAGEFKSAVGREVIGQIGSVVGIKSGTAPQIADAITNIILRGLGIADLANDVAKKTTGGR